MPNPKFDAHEPATCLADSSEWAIYQQRGVYWLYNHQSDVARPVSRPLAWLSQLEAIQYAIREADNV